MRVPPIDKATTGKASGGTSGISAHALEAILTNRVAKARINRLFFIYSLL